MRSTKSSESTSVGLGGTRSSTNRSLISTLDFDAIPKESPFKYSHPDKLYVPPCLSRMSKSIQITNLDSDDDDLLQEPNSDHVSPNGRTGPSGQEIPEGSQEYSETKMKHKPQDLESRESVQSQNTKEIPVLCMDMETSNLQDKAS